MIEALAGADGGGQFLNGCDLPAESGRWTAAAQPEVLTCRQEITALLGLGGADGPWTALVTRGRGLRVFALPAVSENGTLVEPDGTLADLGGRPLPPRCVPLGKWARQTALPSAPPVRVERARMEDGRVVLC